MKMILANVVLCLLAILVLSIPVVLRHPAPEGSPPLPIVTITIHAPDHQAWFCAYYKFD